MKTRGKAFRKKTTELHDAYVIKCIFQKRQRHSTYCYVSEEVSRPNEKQILDFLLSELSVSCEQQNL